jgi:hypothetical protein
MIAEQKWESLSVTARKARYSDFTEDEGTVRTAETE